MTEFVDTISGRIPRGAGGGLLRARTSVLGQPEGCPYGRRAAALGLPSALRDLHTVFRKGEARLAPTGN